MRALQLTLGPARYLLARATSRFTDVAVDGWASGLRLADVEVPPLPGPEWVRLRVLACGICGTDLSTLRCHTSLSLEPFTSFPAVPGHEILARVEEPGMAARGVAAGTRVAVDPILSCAVRGRGDAESCAPCRSGRPALCARAGDAGPAIVGGRPLGPGAFIGYNRDLPGGWGQALVAHAAQLHPIDDRLDDRTAVLLEPLSIALHAALALAPGDGERVLVLGSGPIALGAVWALRASGFRGRLLAQVKRGHEATLARRLGADDAITPAGARAALLSTGARAYRPLVGAEVFAGGGHDLVLDCVGSEATLTQALGHVAAGGRIGLVGCASRLRNLDLAFVWARELRLTGIAGYGLEAWRGERIHTFDLAQRLLLESGAPVRELVTHAFPLGRYREALAAARDRARSGAVKVVLQPDGATPV